MSLRKVRLLCLKSLKTYLVLIKYNIQKGFQIHLLNQSETKYFLNAHHKNIFIKMSKK